MDAENSNRLALVYATDAGFAAVTCASVLSLDAATKQPYHVYILTVDLDDASAQAMRKALQNCKLEIHMLSFDTQAYDALPLPSILPKASYVRIFLQDYVPHHYERLLYIDGDTLVDVDPSPLCQVDMQGQILGAVLDLGRITAGFEQEDKERLSLSGSQGYFNSGLLLIDYKKWRNEDLPAQVLKAFQDKQLVLTLGDQCVLNYVMRGSWLALNYKWNTQGVTANYFLNKPALVHFVGSRKPWRPKDMRYPMKIMQRYRDFYAQNDFEMPLELKELNSFYARLRWMLRMISPRILGRMIKTRRLVQAYNARTKV